MLIFARVCHIPCNRTSAHNSDIMCGEGLGLQTPRNDPALHTRNYRDEGPPRARYLYGLADGKAEHKRMTHHVGNSPVCACACMSLLS